MKYIRTKDGRIIDFDSLTEIAKASVSMDAMEKSCAFEIADTIEELCDRYVVIHKYGEQPKDMCFYEAQYFIDVWTRKVKSNDPIVAIYGAIWTEWGLKYVAKMNEEGELELL